MRAVVIGAGIGGLTASIALARAGYEVVIVERDDTPMPSDVEGAFAWDRRGAPQVRHTHGFPALIRATLRDHFPDVLAALLDAGVREVSVLPASVTPDVADYERHKEDLQVLATRRTTLEFVLRRCALAERGVEFVTGAAVEGLEVRDGAVRGIRLHSDVIEGDVIEGDVVVAASGRRCAAPAWFAEHGLRVEEEEHPTNTIYLSRFYRSDEAPMGYVGGRRAGLGFVVAGADNGAYSATLAVPADDAELRTHLLDEDHFEAVLPLFKEMQPVVERQGEPLTGVQTMGGLINRIRRYPRLDGFFAIGDSHTCTNPLYGRGSSLAVLQAVLVRDALAGGEDYEAASQRRVEPWYEMSLLTDKPEAANLSGFDLQSMRRATASDDPEVAVQMTRMMSLLTTPTELFSDPALVARLQAAGEPKTKPPPAKVLTRDDFLRAGA
ncbi:MAG TPA: NAD-binding protein [Acidimicrobiales bacterium]|nr:NAD-binding protein [Acidimicrobiales bacterium]